MVVLIYDGYPYLQIERNKQQLPLNYKIIKTFSYLVASSDNYFICSGKEDYLLWTL